MLVYGDRTRECEPAVVVGELATRLDGAHDALVAAFIDASELAQGIADVERSARGVDARGAASDRAMRLLVALARAIDDSWTGRALSLEAVRDGLGELARGALPGCVQTRQAEGYAYYALYPEAYLVAVQRAPIAPDHVIGIRSIGTGLAALVAAASGASLPATVRPFGEPHRREVAVAPELLAEWLRDPHATFAVADEGPGLSGSSFGAVIDLLERHGIAADRVLCFPGHRGALGPAASPRHRARWERMHRYCIDAGELMRERLERWIAALVGPLEGPLVDISAGAWRRVRYASEDEWPACFLQQERRKYLARTGSGTWLARFVGLGRTGERAYALALAASAAGFTPEVAGLAHGFLLERWLEGRPLEPRAFDRGALVDRVGRYLAFRTTRTGDGGATRDELIAMVRRNVTLGVGREAADHVCARMPAFEPRRVAIDGKLHAWEWLVQPDRTLVKTDAYDHHAAHDLIGCQDIAWDVVGATIELGLDPCEEQQLATYVDADPRALAFLRPCYLAFQLGRAHLAATTDVSEAPRLRAAAQRYATLLTSRC